MHYMAPPNAHAFEDMSQKTVNESKLSEQLQMPKNELKIEKKTDNEHYEIIINSLHKINSTTVRIKTEKIEEKNYLFLLINNRKRQIELPADMKEKELKARLNQNIITITIPRMTKEPAKLYEFQKNILKNLGVSDEELINLLFKKYDGNIKEIVQELQKNKN
eukprot:gene6463-10469_t